MNFLSHYYFDRTKENPYEVFGMVLPDLLKNADKTWNVHPEKHSILVSSPRQNNIITGWKRHLEVDRIFHNSEFFKYHQHQIKLSIREVISSSPVKPFFLGHIGLELLLDSLLISEKLISIEKFYIKLASIEEEEIRLFLQLNLITDQDKFFRFFNNFVAEKYLYNYADESKIAYALKRICMRLWTNPFTPEQEVAITQCLVDYKKELREDFIIIFDQIDAQIN
ncbi:MAG TPA: hypothetical protein VL125_13475 [Pelobium sp.]|nr:hypothetical protein [Pelobium sp.]